MKPKMLTDWFQFGKNKGWAYNFRIIKYPNQDELKIQIMQRKYSNRTKRWNDTPNKCQFPLVYFLELINPENKVIKLFMQEANSLV